MRAYGTPHALIFPIYGWSLTHIERSFFAALLKERGRGQLTGCFRPFLTCAKRRACGFSAGPSTLMRKIGFLLSFCGGVFRVSLIFLVHSFHSFTPRVIKMLDGNESHLRQDFAAQNVCTAQMRRFWYPWDI